MSAMTPSSIPTPHVSDKTPAPIPPPRTSVPAPPPRQVRFQCQPTKCLEYARDNKTDNDVPAKVGEADEEDPNKKKAHNVTFAETECNIREFVPDQQLVNLKLWNYSNEFKSPRQVVGDEYQGLLEQLATMRVLCDKLKQNNLRRDLDQLQSSLYKYERNARGGFGSIYRDYKVICIN